MKPIFPLVLLGFLAAPALSQEAAIPPLDAPPETPELMVIEARDVADLNEFLWLKRIVAVMADSPVDPRFVQQVELLGKRPEDLALRDVVVILDSNPADDSVLRRKLRPRGFMMALLAKDGSVVLRTPSPWDTREISRSIDKLPLRQQEIDERRGQLRADPALSAGEVTQ